MKKNKNSSKKDNNLKKSKFLILLLDFFLVYIGHALAMIVFLLVLYLTRGIKSDYSTGFVLDLGLFFPLVLWIPHFIVLLILFWSFLKKFKVDLSRNYFLIILAVSSNSLLFSVTYALFQTSYLSWLFGDLFYLIQPLFFPITFFFFYKLFEIYGGKNDL